MASASKPRLCGLRTARIERPDSEVQAIEYILPESVFSDLTESYTNPQSPGSDEWVTYLRIDVGDPDGFG